MTHTEKNLLNALEKMTRLFGIVNDSDVNVWENAIKAMAKTRGVSVKRVREILGQ